MKVNTLYVIGYLAVIGGAIWYLQYSKEQEREKVAENTTSLSDALQRLEDLKNKK